MPVRDHFKPLFNARLLREALEAVHLECSEVQIAIAQRWANSARGGALLASKEKQLQGQFLSEVFGTLLGYVQIVGANQVHHLEPETSSKAVKGYRPPDARLGWYGPAIDRTRAVLELKSPSADLDAKQGAALRAADPGGAGVRLFGQGGRLPLGDRQQLPGAAPVPHRPRAGLLPALPDRGPRRPGAAADLLLLARSGDSAWIRAGHRERRRAAGHRYPCRRRTHHQGVLHLLPGPAHRPVRPAAGGQSGPRRHAQGHPPGSAAGAGPEDP